MLTQLGRLSKPCQRSLWTQTFIILTKLDNNWTVRLTFTELSKNGNPLDGYKHKKWKRIEHKIQDRSASLVLFVKSDA